MRYAKQKNNNRHSYSLKSMAGIDRSAFANPGSLYDACNLTSDGKPYWKARPPRGRWQMVSEGNSENTKGLFVQSAPISGACSLNEGLCWTAGTKIYIGGKQIEGVVFSNTERKQLIPMGRDLFVIPDGVLLKQDENGTWTAHNAGVSYSSNGAAVLVGYCAEDLQTAKFCAPSDSAPDSNLGIAWLDTSGVVPVAKEYSETSGWTAVEPYAWFFMSTGIESGLYEGAVVNVSLPGILRMTDAQIVKTDTNTVFLLGNLQGDTKTGDSLHITCPFPNVDYAVACQNRIWGCRHGKNKNGEYVNEIFCSALGEPLVWSRYGTGADDCYCVSVGEAGDFTGAAVLYDNVIFFKENTVFCISGTEPANYRLSVSAGHGVRKGCERSIAQLGGSVVYCGVDGVYRTNGYYSVRLCDGFQPTALENATGGVLGEKYYLAAQQQDGKRFIYVFTAGENTWYREDDRYKVQYFIPQRNCLYMFCIPLQGGITGLEVYWVTILLTDCFAPGKSTNCLLIENTQESDYGYSPDTDYDWYALTNELDFETGGTKAVREVQVRFELGESSLFCVELRTDRDERLQLGRFTGKGLRSRTLHVNVLPCESIQLYFYGHGECTLREVNVVYDKMKEEYSRV